MGRVALGVVGALVCAYLLLPILVVIPTSFNASAYMDFPPRAWSLRWYRAYFESRAWTEPTWLSLQVALAATAIATLLGTLAAFGLVRGRFAGRRILEYFLLSPMIVPHIVFAVGAYFLFSRLALVGRPAALYLAHTVVATPLVVIVVASALRTYDRTLEQAARSLGAGYTRTLLHVTIPLLRPAVLSAAAFAFLISFDEVILAIFLGGPGATTLPKKMWDSVRYEIDPTLTAVASLLVVLSVLILTAAETLRAAAARNRAPRDRA